MKDILISDITLREESQLDYSFSFKEKIEIVKLLDKLHINVIETAPVTNGKIDILFLHSIAPIIKNSAVSCPVSLDKESVHTVFDAIKSAKKPILHIMVPVSTVQMEYLLHKKPKATLEAMEETITEAVLLTENVEVSMMDSTRADRDFLIKAVQSAIKCGAKTITICDSAGEMLPSEFEEMLLDIKNSVPELDKVALSVECSDSLNMASACAVSCINSGVSQIKTSVASVNCPSLASICHIFREKADKLSVKTSINMPVLDNSINKIKMIITQSNSISPFDAGTNSTYTDISLNGIDDIKSVKTACEKLGYDLSADDIQKVYEEFVKISKSKKVDARELDAIIASVAVQVEPTYKLNSYVINNGNIMIPTACIELEKGGKIHRGFCTGDGPIDAAFLAIEQITGHHFELDDFQIQAVTEGREAMGSSIVKLRYNGKPYSGKGISTDIIGASINAYINALNKICFEEMQ